MLEYIHRSKRGADHRYVVSGGLYAGASEMRWQNLGPSEIYRLAFQIVDDVLDVTQTLSNWEKPRGKTLRQKRQRTPPVRNRRISEESRYLVETALASLESFGSRQIR